MGQNLSDLKVVDTSKDVLSPTDRNADIILGVIWASAFYSCAMIFCACTLLNRWSGPKGDRSVNICSVFGAFVLSIAWPVVLILVRT
ncbi:hypothetical protein QBC33DRAFT_171460 [Phialemonium atrogriseum]|uniref:Uncharacterized protein n=1 Tax=Phialemonium atrogriseum TaxID=1093897 RepID=A0AAJ0C861_9PEZI|nr:uncharacterized protein QBC33DRAFT_171460 [Phialemonium atrogriseum]KAK1771935.1 hypothetical protein QBC33DRAFT_171460 [Phialemonium atrogriseum]